MTKEDILNHAKTIYKVGTRFRLAHILNDPPEFVITNDHYIDWNTTGSGYIVVLYKKSGVAARAGGYTAAVYDGDRNRWAKIITSPHEEALAEALKIIYEE